MEILIVVIVLISGGIIKGMLFEVKRKNRRDYYRNDYLKSDAWQRKRFVVLRRDNWKCKYCGAKATQVHHLKYAKYNIGKEPIHWLVSICGPCHDKQHDIHSRLDI